MGKVEVICKYCGEKKLVRDNPHNYNKYCSRDCCNKDKGFVIGGDKIEITCMNCGNHKLVKRSEYERGQHRYCSKSCAAKHKPSPTQFKKTWFGRVCKVCGIFFYKKYPSIMTCSEECWHKLQSESLKNGGKNKGENNPFFGKTHTPDVRKVMSTKRSLQDPKYSPTKTEYNGIIFRSKLESRFAKCLDNLGYTWSYEPARFILDLGSYTPDFYVDDLDCWFEVKGWLTKEHEKLDEKYAEFSQKENWRILFNKDIKKLEKGEARI